MSTSISLWLVAPDTDANHISQCMKNLCPLPPTIHSPNSFPTFTPHVTLLSLHVPLGSISTTAIDLRNAISSATASNAGPIPITFASIESGSHFYRSVFVAVHDSGALRTLHASVHASMSAEPRTPKFPHMSLCYIDDADAQLREQVAKDAILVDGGASLVYGQQGELIQGFDCQEIWIMECGPEVREWRAIEKIRFAA
jgi:2'-5' RNA ligase